MAYRHCCHKPVVALKLRGMLFFFSFSLPSVLLSSSSLLDSCSSPALCSSSSCDPSCFILLEISSSFTSAESWDAGSCSSSSGPILLLLPDYYQFVQQGRLNHLQKIPGLESPVHSLAIPQPNRPVLTTYFRRIAAHKH
jgi:hypothetical protein